MYWSIFTQNSLNLQRQFVCFVFGRSLDVHWKKYLHPHYHDIMIVYGNLYI